MGNLSHTNTSTHSRRAALVRNMHLVRSSEMRRLWSSHQREHREQHHQPQDPDSDLSTEGRELFLEEATGGQENQLFFSRGRPIVLHPFSAKGIHAVLCTAGISKL